MFEAKKMSKVISMNSSVEHQELIADIKETLKKTEDDLFVHAVNLCSCIAWRDWCETREEGEFEFDMDMIKESGDKNAVMLVEMMERLNELYLNLQ